MLAPCLSLLVSGPVSAPVSPPFVFSASKQCHCATVELWLRLLLLLLLLLHSCACSAVYTLGYTLLPASCCEFHFRCDILLQNFIFNLCTYYTACHAPFTVSASRSLFLCVCSTYLAFVFIFSVIVLFLPCHGNSCSSSTPLPLPFPASAHVSMLLIICGYVRSILHGRLMLLIIITSIMTGFL